MNWAALIWLGLMLAFIVAEAACPFHLISVWFAVGSLIALIASLLGAELWLQILLFFVVSGALLALLWPLVRKVLNPTHTKTNLDSVIGSEGVVTAPIDNIAATGTVKLGAMDWTARSSGGEAIEVGTVVKVDRIEGVKIFVSKAEVTVK